MQKIICQEVKDAFQRFCKNMVKRSCGRFKLPDSLSRSLELTGEKPHTVTRMVPWCDGTETLDASLCDIKVLNYYYFFLMLFSDVVIYHFWDMMLSKYYHFCGIAVKCIFYRFHNLPAVWSFTVYAQPSSRIFFSILIFSPLLQGALGFPDGNNAAHDLTYKRTWNMKSSCFVHS